MNTWQKWKCSRSICYGKWTISPNRYSGMCVEHLQCKIRHFELHEQHLFVNGFAFTFTFTLAMCLLYSICVFNILRARSYLLSTIWSWLANYKAQITILVQCFYGFDWNQPPTTRCLVWTCCSVGQHFRYLFSGNTEIYIRDWTDVDANLTSIYNMIGISIDKRICYRHCFSLRSKTLLNNFHWYEPCKSTHCTKHSMQKLLIGIKCVSKEIPEQIRHRTSKMNCWYLDNDAFCHWKFWCLRKASGR